MGEEDSLLERLPRPPKRSILASPRLATPAFAEFTHRLPAHLAQNNCLGGGGRPRPRNLPGRKDWGSSMRKRPADEGVAFISRSKLRSPPLSRPRVTLPSVMRQSSPARRPSCATRPLRNWLAAPRTAPRIKGGDDCKRSATPTVIGVRGFLLASRQPAARPSASRQ